MREAVVLELAEESLRTAGHLRLRAKGVSMLPIIPPGSVVEVEKTSPDSVQPGDIVLMRTEQGFRLHRLVGIHNGQVVTRGDSHWHKDPPAPLESLLGRAVRILRDY